MENKNIIDRGINSDPSQGSGRIDIKELMSCCKMSAFPFLKESHSCDSKLCKSNNNFVEVRFKNTRKEYFIVDIDMKISVGDIVSVETSPGHDIGIVTLNGYLAYRQMLIKGVNPEKDDIRKVYRKAKNADIQRWMMAIANEQSTIKRTKLYIKDFQIDMKLNDVEYQGDGTKAIFYYTAEGRIDFRELIKVLAREFRVRVEMKQIGARQESAKIGGIGQCGREMCCSSWLTNFMSVSTQTARTQQLVLNPQKLAGQCTKLKCCLNYEYPIYVEALKKFPNNTIVLKTKKGDAVHVKSDIFNNLMWYSYKNDRSSILGLSVEVVKNIIEMNKAEKFPLNIEDLAKSKDDSIDYENALDHEDIRKLGLTDE